jgi:hypothetical protein
MTARVGHLVRNALLTSDRTLVCRLVGLLLSMLTWRARQLENKIIPGLKLATYKPSYTSACIAASALSGAHWKVNTVSAAIGIEEREGRDRASGITCAERRTHQPKHSDLRH